MKRRILAIVLAAVLFAVIAGWAYVGDYYRADDTAVAAMSTADDVRVEQNGRIAAFIPEQAETGFIFYPGGKVEAIAYAPLMHALAEQDVLCVLVEMPLNLAVLDMNAADDIAQQYPQIQHWFIGGHSLGGSMAAGYAAKHAESYDGLVLLAAYSTADLRAVGMPVISLYGSEDGVLNLEKYAENQKNLPVSFEEHVITGGNHAGFGSYGSQDGDGGLTISADAQIEETVRLLSAFFTSH